MLGINSYTGKPIAIGKSSLSQVFSSGCFLSMGQAFQGRPRGMVEFKLTITDSIGGGQDDAIQDDSRTESEDNE